MADRDVIQALRAIKALALQHHGDEPPSALLHALLVEIPAECDSAIAALDAADARPVCRNCGHIDRLHDAGPFNTRRCNEPRCSCEDYRDAAPTPAPRCPYFSRAWGVQCDRPAGHDGNCQSGGDGFAPGYTPTTPAPRDGKGG